MAARGYVTNVVSGPGGTFTLRVPILAETAGVEAALARECAPVAAQTAAVLVEGAQRLYPTGPVTASFTPVVRPWGPVRAGFSSGDPVLPFMEFRTRPHWPPAGAQSRLAGWVTRHPGAPPARVVARLIAARGTVGRYVLGNLLQTVAERVFRPGLVAAVRRVFDGL